MPKGRQLKVNGKFDKRFFTSSFFAAAMKIMKIVQTGGVSHGTEEGGGGGLRGARAEKGSHFRQIQTNGWRVAIATADSQLAVESREAARGGSVYMRTGNETFSLRSANGLSC